MQKLLYIGLLITTCIVFFSCGEESDDDKVLPFRRLTTHEGLADNEVKNIWEGNDGRLRIETATSICLYDGQSFSKDTTATPPKPSGHEKTYQDKSGRQWKYSTLNDTASYQTQEGWKTLHVPSRDTRQANSLRGIQDAGNGNVWVATDHQGLYLYHMESNTMTHVKSSKDEDAASGEDNINTIFVDHHGTLWVGHVKKGLSYYSPSTPQFLRYQNQQWKNVSALLEDHQGCLWIGTDGYGLIHKRPYSDRIMEKLDVPGNIVVSLHEDRRGRLWIGTYLHGLLCYDQGKIRRYTTKNSRLADNSVYSLQEDAQGNIWIGTLWGCLQQLNPEKEKWRSFPTSNKDENTIMCFLNSDSTTLYAGTLSGLCRIHLHTGQREQLLGNRNGRQFSQKDILTLYRDSRQLLWLCHNKGVTIWDEATDSLYYLDRQKGLCDDVTRGIAEDTLGRIWLTTSNGCSVVSVQAKDTMVFSIDNYFLNDGLTDSNFSRHSAIKLTNGDMVLGSADGYTIACLAEGVSRDRQRSPILRNSLWAWLFGVFLVVMVVFEIRWYKRWRHQRKEMAREKLVSPSELNITSLDEQFIQKAIKAVEDHLLSDYTVEDLASAVGLTRGHLYKKLMAITGKGPADFIRTIRLKRARQLLEESGMQISEIAYAVGYSSPKIFSRNFKAEFGMPPTEYLKKKGKDTSDTLS